MGGGAIRAASKVAGITAASGGFRGITAGHFSLSSAARKVFSGRPVAAMVDDVKLVASNSESGVLQKPCVELDDRMLPFKEEGVDIDASEPMPRVVFGGPPTLQEAKEATSELSIAIEKTFLSSPYSVLADQDASLSLSSKEGIETKACATTEIVGASSIPGPVFMAFKFLHESSKAKDVVASIASDTNVWTAVMQNEELQKFVESQRARVSSTEPNLIMESVGDYDAKSTDYSFEHAESEQHWSGFSDFFQKMKSRVGDLLASMSDYFKDLFGGKGEGKSADAFMERSFMGLAVMAILVIVLKRV